MMWVNWIFLVVAIGIVFLGVFMLVKKNGGFFRMEGKYTEESLSKYSGIIGISYIVLGVIGAFLFLEATETINIISGINSVTSFWIPLIPLIIACVINQIASAVILKKISENK